MKILIKNPLSFSCLILFLFTNPNFSLPNSFNLKLLMIDNLIVLIVTLEEEVGYKYSKTTE